MTKAYAGYRGGEMIFNKPPQEHYMGISYHGSRRMDIPADETPWRQKEHNVLGECV